MQDNQAFRALFTLPQVRESASTSLTVPETPAPKNETGDRELDALLWLRDCIKTAHPVLIEKALEAFKKIKTPVNELEDRYTKHVARVSNNHFGAVLMTFGFADLESLAERVIKRQTRSHEAISRFGSVDQLFDETPAEAACKTALKGLGKKKGALWGYDSAKADQRFMKLPELIPTTLADCLHAQEYSSELHQFRQASLENAGDHCPEFQEYEDFCFRRLAHIKPRTREEALSVLDHLEEREATDRTESPAIIRNLIAGGWA
ncbi:hypothetical protein [Ottowia thiooxydans]|uniref:hypothetical protein n=1 Tax=Ottowia thiooxydans TaxID=219182 RepID=UPI0003F813A8|nr:hypothetical protein [Ottowia thiooxydans]